MAQQIQTSWKDQTKDLHRMYKGLADSSIEGFNKQNFTYYVIELKGESGFKQILYSSVFTCPITSRHFPSGQLGKSKEIQGSFYYKTRRRAMQAAAAKAIDCLSMNGHNPSEVMYHRCCEVPFMLPSGPPLPPLPYNVAKYLKDKRLKNQWSPAA
eukprot:110532_1